MQILTTLLFLLLAISLDSLELQGLRGEDLQNCEDQSIGQYQGISLACLDSLKPSTATSAALANHARLQFFVVPQEGYRPGLLAFAYPKRTLAGDPVFLLVSTKGLVPGTLNTISVDLPDFDWNAAQGIRFAHLTEDPVLAPRLDRFHELRLAGMTESKMIPPGLVESFASRRLFARDHGDIICVSLGLSALPKSESISDSEVIETLRSQMLTSGQLLFWVSHISPITLIVVNLILIFLARRYHSAQTLALFTLPLLAIVSAFVIPIQDLASQVDSIRLEELKLKARDKLQSLEKVSNEALLLLENEAHQNISSQIPYLPHPLPGIHPDIVSLQRSLDAIRFSTDPGKLLELAKQEDKEAAAFCDQHPISHYCLQVEAQPKTQSLNPEALKVSLTARRSLRHPLVARLGELEFRTGMALLFVNGKEFYHSSHFGEGMHYKFGFVYLFQQIQSLVQSRNDAWKKHVSAARRFVEEEGGEMDYIYHFLNQPYRFIPSGTREQDAGFRYHYYWMPNGNDTDFWISMITLRPQRLLYETALLLKPDRDFVGFAGSSLSPDWPFVDEGDVNKSLSLAKLSREGEILPLITDQGVYLVHSGAVPWLDETKLVIRLDLIESFTRYLKRDLLLIAALALCLGLALLACQRISARLLRFLREIAKVADQFSAGDFSPYRFSRSDGNFSKIQKQWSELGQALLEKQRLMQFLSPASHQLIFREPLHSRRQEVTILFTAHRDGVDTQLQTLARQHELIVQNGGMIDKFTGAALLAVFEGVDAASRAYLTALSLGDQCNLCTGIASGALVLGAVGSANRKDFTVIGDVVNTAARLQYLAVNEGFKVCICAKSQQLLPQSESELKHIRKKVKGKSEELDLYVA